MACISGEYFRQEGPVLTLIVAPPGTLLPGEETTGKLKYRALLDTGSQITCISPALAKDLGLSPEGQITMCSASHTVAANSYAVDISFPEMNDGLLRQEWRVVEFTPSPGAGFEVLLGRDILCEGVFTMSFDGHFTFSL